MDPLEVPAESQFQLDLNINDLAEGNISNQEHWIMAMRAGRIAGMRVRGQKVRWASLPKCRRWLHDPPTEAFQTSLLQDTLEQDIFADVIITTKKRRPSKAVLSLLEPSDIGQVSLSLESHEILGSFRHKEVKISKDLVAAILPTHQHKILSNTSPCREEFTEVKRSEDPDLL